MKNSWSVGCGLSEGRDRTWSAARRLLWGGIVLVFLAGATGEVTPSTSSTPVPAQADPTQADPVQRDPLLKAVEAELLSAPNQQKLSAGEAAMAAQLSEKISAAEWLGPLAPVALSPFFGLTCLSGLALYGQDLIPGTNHLLQNSVLRQPAVFWSLLVLTILTSLPKFTKVSKPFAQVMDQVEAYAGIVILLVIRFFGQPEVGVEPTVVQMGMFSVSVDVLFAIAAWINILVIHGVKFFFEFLIWMTPFPMLDALFEIMNKAVCAGLMTLYAYSPVAATAANLALFAVCLILFRWCHRQTVFYRTMLLDPLCVRLWPSYGQVGAGGLAVFPQTACGPIPARAPCQLVRTDSGWELQMRTWLGQLRSCQITRLDELLIRRGFLFNTVSFAGDEQIELCFSHRFNRQWTQVEELLG
ncbi:MAG: hypothetical protein KDA58_10740 [Planctomycetaceae bacterium]|nr:hypothetical protein [Planctomycetaceae bacterium]